MRPLLLAFTAVALVGVAVISMFNFKESEGISHLQKQYIQQFKPNEKYRERSNSEATKEVQFDGNYYWLTPREEMKLKGKKLGTLYGKQCSKADIESLEAYPLLSLLLTLGVCFVIAEVWAFRELRIGFLAAGQIAGIVLIGFVLEFDFAWVRWLTTAASCFCIFAMQFFWCYGPPGKGSDEHIDEIL